MAFAEDLAQFFDPDGFAVEALIERADGADVRTANVIVETPTAEQVFFSEGRVSTTTPRAVGRTADLGDVRRGYTLTVGATVYEVTGPPEDDGTGVSTVPLRKR